MDIEAIRDFQYRIKKEWEQCTELTDDDIYILITNCEMLLGCAIELQGRLQWKKVVENFPIKNKLLELRSESLGIYNHGTIKQSIVSKEYFWSTPSGAYPLAYYPEWREIGEDATVHDNPEPAEQGRVGGT